MKKSIAKQKLSLNKQTIKFLNPHQMKLIQGGGKNIVTNGCQTEGKNDGC